MFQLSIFVGLSVPFVTYLALCKVANKVAYKIDNPCQPSVRSKPPHSLVIKIQFQWTHLNPSITGARRKMPAVKILNKSCHWRRSSNEWFTCLIMHVCSIWLFIKCCTPLQQHVGWLPKTLHAVSLVQLINQTLSSKTTLVVFHHIIG